MGAGKSTALAALAAARRGRALQRRGRPRALRRRAGCATRSSSAGARRSRRRRGRPLSASPQRAFADRRGPRVARGAAVAARRRADAAWLARARRLRAAPPPRAAVVEVPLLFEAGLRALYDATIAVVADERAAQRAGRRARPCAGRRARRAPALAGGEGATRDLRRAQRWHRGGSRARTVGGSCQAWKMSRRSAWHRSRRSLSSDCSWG